MGNKGYDFYSTIISYGISEKERQYIDDAVSWRRMEHLNTEVFQDVLAVPAAVIIIRFSTLSENELKAFNECFEEHHVAIISPDLYPGDHHFAYYGEIDFFSDDKRECLLLHSFVAILDKKCRIENVEVTKEKIYSVASLTDNGFRITTFQNFKRIDSQEYDLRSSGNFPINLNNLVCYSPQFKVCDVIYDFRKMADECIDLHLLISIEYPITALMNLDEKIQYFFQDKENYLTLPESDKIVLLMRMYFDTKESLS